MSPTLCENESECPYCGETITVLIDPSITEQTYIEDCSVCCRPIEIHARCEDEELIEVTASRSV
jgi:hypothetical protein